MSGKMYSRVVAIFFVLSISLLFSIGRAFSQSTACTHYASPTGTGNGLSQSSPFRISNFWSVAKPGHVLCLLDGTYTGSSSMINPPQNLKGTSSSPITIRALNDGKVLLDGRRAHTPVYLYYNDWFVLEGFNACCAGWDAAGDGSVVSLSSANHNIIRRVAAWDATDANTNIMGASYSNYNLFEDVAGWGIARKVFSFSQGGNYTKLRRSWGRWDGSHFVGPKMTYNLGYNNYDLIVENAIGSWSGQNVKETYTLLCDPGTPYSPCGKTHSGYSVDQPQGIFSDDGFDGDKNSRSKLLGSIAYIQSTDRFPYPYAILLTGINSFEIADTVAYVQPGSNSSKYTFGLIGLYDATSTNLIARNLTSIGGAGAHIESDWQKTSIVSGSSLAATFGSSQTMFNTSSGARICYRYKDGVLTNQPLWPWPMNQRIKDAMIASGRSPVDVTATIESMFGPIPSACKSTATTTAVSVSKPSAPINLQAQRQ